MKNSMADDHVMDAKQRRRYTLERKLPHNRDVRHNILRNLKGVVIHNAYTMREVRDNLQNQMSILYIPPCSTESHWFIRRRGEIHVVNSRGVTRLERDKDQAEELQKIVERAIPVTVLHYSDDHCQATHRFQDFAFKLVDEAFSQIDAQALKREGKLTLIFGPHRSLPEKELRNSMRGVNDFLNYRIFHIAGNYTLSFDYSFADQAHNVLHQVYARLSARFPSIAVDLFPYGKIGALNPDLAIGDIGIPKSAMEESDILSGDERSSAIHNQWDGAALGTGGTTINSSSVLRQRRSTLEKCLQAGGDFIEMEWSALAGVHQGLASKYPNLGRVRFYAAGIISDKPLQGLTLADTKYPEEQERKVAEYVIEQVKLNKISVSR